VTLVLDERPALAGAPGVHCLIAGVSHYPHLPGGGGPAAEKSYGMRQLSSTAATAYRVYRWLLDRRDRLPLPLATVRLLLSPSPAETAAEPALAAAADRCTRAAFAAEARAWRRDARAHRDGMSWFYFAGHGVQRRKGDAVLLLEDFGDPDEGPLTNAASFDNLFYGMAPPAALTQTVARRQAWFIDACRLAPADFRSFEWLHVPDLWEVELSGVDDRSAPAFFASLPGAKAYALPGEQTLFSRALLAALEGSGVDSVGDDDDGAPRYGVTVYSLDRALQAELAALNDEHGGDQDYVLSGLVDEALLVRHPAAPEVAVVVEVDPAEAADVVRFEVTDAEDAVRLDVGPPLTPYPFEGRLPMGFYQVRGTVDPPRDGLADFKRWAQIRPPRQPVRLRVRR